MRYAGVAWGEWTTVDGNSASATVTGLDNGTEYRFKLRAVNAGGTSKPAPAAAPWYVAATPKIPLPPAPTGLTVTPGDGYLDIDWGRGNRRNRIRRARQDIRQFGLAQRPRPTSRTRRTDTPTSNTIDYVAVRARNAGGASAWTDVSRMPSANWLTTVIQGGASGQSVQAQNQLTAPASITVTRDNSIRDEKLHVTWAAVSGAGGYNLACTAGSGNTPLSGWNWWHCGSVASGSTTTFTVDHDNRGGLTRGSGLVPLLHGRRARGDHQSRPSRPLAGIVGSAAGL